MEEKDPLQWLHDLLAEVHGFDPELYPPRTSRAAHETIIGTVPAEIRKVYSFRQHCKREMEQMKLDHKYSSTAEKESNRIRYAQLDAKVDACEAIMTGCVVEFFGILEAARTRSLPRELGSCGVYSPRSAATQRVTA